MGRLLALLGLLGLLAAGCGGRNSHTAGTAPSAPPVSGGTALKKPPDLPNKPAPPVKK
jgi:hypothetical protein